MTEQDALRPLLRGRTQRRPGLGNRPGRSPPWDSRPGPCGSSTATAERSSARCTSGPSSAMPGTGREPATTWPPSRNSTCGCPTPSRRRPPSGSSSGTRFPATNRRRPGVRARPAPGSREAFPVPYRTGPDRPQRAAESGQAMVKVRGEESRHYAPGPAATPDSGRGPADLRPGDLVVIDSSAEIFTRTIDGTCSARRWWSVASAEADEGDGMDARWPWPCRRRAALPAGAQRRQRQFRLEWSPDQGQVAGSSGSTARRILDGFAENFEDVPNGPA